MTGTVVLERVPWSDPRGEALRAAQRVEIEERYGTPDSEPGPAPTADDVAVFLIALVDGVPAGCGGLRRIDDEHGEIKRMYADPAVRGRGVATRVLRGLEDAARELGWTRLVLETGDRQPDAMRFYEREGYAPIPRFGHYLHSEESRCYGRDLAAGELVPGDSVPVEPGAEEALA
jgi:putative acetyltransferase